MAYDSWVCIGEKKAPTSIGLKGFNKRWNKVRDLPCNVRREGG